MRQYSADRVHVTFFGLDLTPGLAAGTFVQVERKTAAFRPVADGLGDVVRVFSPDRSASVTLTIDAESRTHQELITFANADRAARSIVGPLVITDSNTGEIIALDQAFIEDLPNIEKSSAAAALPWVFHGRLALQQSFAFERNRIGA